MVIVFNLKISKNIKILILFNYILNIDKILNLMSFNFILFIKSDTNH